MNVQRTTKYLNSGNNRALSAAVHAVSYIFDFFIQPSFSNLRVETAQQTACESVALGAFKHEIIQHIQKPPLKKI